MKPEVIKQIEEAAERNLQAGDWVDLDTLVDVVDPPDDSASAPQNDDSDTPSR